MHQKNPKPELVYNVPELSRLLRISTAHGYKVIREGWVPSLRLGKRIVIPKAALDKLLSRGDQHSL